jgi:N-acetylglucosaminyldiphosphoundecaprenol N-acetyl-beta-D-mannosaminyltransferase
MSSPFILRYLLISLGSSIVSRTPKVNILGVGIDPINMDDALEQIDRWIDLGESKYVCVTPVHSVMECQNDESLRQIFNDAGMVTPDGMPVVWICQWNGNLHNQFPKMQTTGTISPPYKLLSDAENEALVDQINATNPDIVWVGLGSPKQERWMAKNIDRLNASVVIGVGAAFDFHAGRVRQAPRWMQRSGTEWLFRLLSEPRRLWRRYLVGNSLFVLKFTAQVCGLKSYTLAKKADSIAPMHEAV